MDTNRLHRDTNALLAAPIMQAHIYSSEEKHIREKTKGIEKKYTSGVNKSRELGHRGD